MSQAGNPGGVGGLGSDLSSLPLFGASSALASLVSCQKHMTRLCLGYSSLMRL